MTQETNNPRSALNLSEVAFILGDVVKELEQNTQVPELLLKTYQYALRFATINKRSTAVELRSELERLGICDDQEIASLVTLCPLSEDETKALIPSMKRHSEHEIHRTLKIIG